MPCPCLRPVYSNDGARLPASYANFLIINDAVLLPAYDDPADEEARAVLCALLSRAGYRCRQLPAPDSSSMAVITLRESMQLAEGIMGPVAVSAPA